MTIPKPRTIAHIKALNNMANGHFFDRATINFFDSLTHGRVYANTFFITSEKFMSEARKYTVRCIMHNGAIRTVSRFEQHGTLAEAQDHARVLESFWKPALTSHPEEDICAHATNAIVGEPTPLYDLMQGLQDNA